MKPEVDLDSRSLEHGSFEKQRKLDSLTSNTLRMKKLCLKKGFHFIVFAVKGLINLSENQHLTFSRSMYLIQTKCHSFVR